VLYSFFVANLKDFSAVKECWKSVKIWRNYRHKRVARFWDTVYITTHVLLLLLLSATTSAAAASLIVFGSN